MKKIILACALLYCVNSFAQNVDCDNLIGSWHNQRRSTLAIASINSTTGQISGSYTILNAAGKKETFPLTGYAHTKVPGTDGISTVIDFCVSFPNYNSMTAWSGYCSSPKGVPTIHTIWHLVSAKANAPYNHITTDVDDFTPGAAQ
jgi:hypothetical protein